MSITPSKALLDALVPATLRAAAAGRTTMVKSVNAAGPAVGAPAARPDTLPQQGAARPMRRGSILDISV